MPSRDCNWKWICGSGWDLRMNRFVFVREFQHDSSRTSSEQISAGSGGLLTTASHEVSECSAKSHAHQGLEERWRSPSHSVLCYQGHDYIFSTEWDLLSIHLRASSLSGDKCTVLAKDMGLQFNTVRPPAHSLLITSDHNLIWWSDCQGTFWTTWWASPCRGVTQW